MISRRRFLWGAQCLALAQAASAQAAARQAGLAQAFSGDFLVGSSGRWR